MIKMKHKTTTKTIIAAGCSAVLVGAGIAVMATSSCSGHQVLYIAHRGAPGGYNTDNTKHFENNLESFIASGQNSKFYGLETDVYMTSDEKFVVVHDDKPFRASDGTRNPTKYLGGYATNEPN
jgi:glycerophosphoryl diester phosphodiesterase